MRNKLRIPVKYHADIEPLEEISVGNWIDLRAAETVSLKAGEDRRISLGVSMKLPYGYEAYIVPRGSTYKNFGVIQANHKGVVDNSYSGTNDIWMFPAIAMRDTTIQKGDRICQFRIMEIQPPVEFVAVDTLDDEGRGGFGSTGTR